MPETTTQPLFDQDDLIISAARYYIGRTTAAASAFALQLARAWHHLSPYVQGILKRDLQQAFFKDDAARQIRQGVPDADQKSWALPLGHDEDREAWDKVRQAWAKEPAPEPIKPEPRPQLDLFNGAPQEPIEGVWQGMRVRLMPHDPNAEQPPF